MRIFALIVMTLGCPKSEEAPPDTQEEAPAYIEPSSRVILVVIDGARYTETLGGQYSYTPELEALAAQGCSPGPMYNMGYTATKWGTASIHTGVWDDWADADPELEQDAHYYYPTHWEYFRKASNAPEEKALYSLPSYSWESIWKPSYQEGYGPDYWPKIYPRGFGDTSQTAAFLAELEASEPDFAMLYLPNVDSAGHSGDWEYYLETLQEADRLVGYLWSELQQMEHYAGKTNLLVTSDHGRHDDEHGGFQDHGCDCQGCREVTFVAVGPDINPECSPSSPYELVDIVPSIGAILGFTPEFTQGVVMEDLLK